MNTKSLVTFVCLVCFCVFAFGMAWKFDNEISAAMPEPMSFQERHPRADIVCYSSGVVIFTMTNVVVMHEDNGFVSVFKDVDKFYETRGQLVPDVKVSSESCVIVTNK